MSKLSHSNDESMEAIEMENSKHDWHRPDEEMHDKQTSCPKCGLEFKTMLHRHCKHPDCPVREHKANKS